MVNCGTGRVVRASTLGAALMLAACAPSLWAFGQNKVRYDRFEWRTCETAHFLIHYYEGAEPLLPEVAAHAEAAYTELSAFFHHDVKIQIPLLLYRNRAEFEQTGVQLEPVEGNVGAFSDPFQDRMVLPADLPPAKLRQLIQHELVHIFQFSFFFGHNLSRAAGSRIPAWALEGMASWLAHDEDSMDRMVLRDAVVSGLVPSLGEDGEPTYLTYRVGHAAFAFMDETYGQEKVQAFMQEYRRKLGYPAAKVIRNVFHEDMADVDAKFRRWLNLRCMPDYLARREVWEQGREAGRRRGEGAHIFSPAASPDGKLIAAITTRRGRADLALFAADGGEEIRVLTRYPRRPYEHMVTGAFVGENDLAWSPDGRLLAFFARRGKGHVLMLVRSSDGRMEKSFSLDGLHNAVSPSFSPDGRWLAFAAMRGTQPDIFRISLQDGAVEPLTSDVVFEQSPAWVSDTQIIFSSWLGPSRKLMRLRLPNGGLEQLTFGESDDVQPAISRDGRTLYFASDRSGGVFNLFALDMETGAVSQRSDLFTGAFQPAPLPLAEGGERLAYSALREGRFRLFLLEPSAASPAPLPPAAKMPAAVAENKKSALPPLPFDSERTGADSAAGASGLIREDSRQPYHPVLRLADVRVSAGWASGGTLLTDSYISFSDRLGGHRLSARLATARQFPQAYFSYLNTRGRWDWGGSVLDERDFYYLFYDEGEREARRSFHRAGLRAEAAYALNRFYRVEGSFGFFRREQAYPVTVLDAGGNPAGFHRLLAENDEPQLTLSFVGDTTAERPFGSFRGWRLRLDAAWAPEAGDASYRLETVDSGGLPAPAPPSGGSGFRSASLDFRHYLPLMPRTVLASRVFGAWSGGALPQVFSFGGVDTMRGLPYRSINGSRAFYMNHELRFPLIDRLDFAGGPGFSNIRGLLFWDAGGAWFEGEGFTLFRGGRLHDGVSSVGAGLSLLYGSLEFVWDFAWLTDMERVESGPRTSFWVGRAF